MAAEGLFVVVRSGRRPIRGTRRQKCTRNERTEAVAASIDFVFDSLAKERRKERRGKQKAIGKKE
jgi:hypothetical protein